MIKRVNKNFIIAEIGVNHGNDLGVAMKLIDGAKIAGANAAKFQTFSAKNLSTNRTPKAPYQVLRDSSKSHREMLKLLELPRANHQLLKEYCHSVDLEFISTAYSLEDAEFLIGLGVDKVKVASADIVDTRLLGYLSKNKICTILSTGMASLSEVKRALEIFRSSESSLWLLHCISEYPTPPSNANLSRIEILRQLHSGIIGYSDHTVGSEAAQIAFGLGARVFEKHLTFDRQAEGPDHFASADIDEFRDYVSKIRGCEILLGDSSFQRSPDEEAMALTSRKSLHYARNIKAGERLTEIDMRLARPGDGFFWDQRNLFLNNELKNSVSKDQKIDLVHFQ